MIVAATEPETIDQWRQWEDRALTHSRQAKECRQLAQAMLQGYANVKALAAGVVVGAVYRDNDQRHWQVTNVCPQIDSDEDGRQRIVVCVQIRAVDVHGLPVASGCTIALPLEQWDSTGYRATGTVGDPVELLPF